VLDFWVEKYTPGGGTGVLYSITRVDVVPKPRTEVSDTGGSSDHCPGWGNDEFDAPPNVGCRKELIGLIFRITDFGVFVFDRCWIIVLNAGNEFLLDWP
jgi:hypothetical protein